ncbi:MAG TPA: hypothetical protein VL137_15660 [Polyangiaceae bacterium]|nr:hypothetical protein [Polyangiaceae bacterium]
MANEVSGLSLPALKHAASEVLGAEATIRIETMPAKGDDSALLELAPQADSVAELWWTDDSRQTIYLHFFLKSRGRWIDRKITFDPSDADAERGRTLGFALSSMLVSEQVLPTAGVRRPLQPELAPADRAPGNVPSGYSLGLAGLLSTGIAGFANGGGALADMQLRLSAPLWLRFGGSLRFGDIPPAQATSRDIVAFAGISWRPVSRETTGPWSFGINAGAGVDWLWVTHLSEDDTEPAHRSSWFPVFHSLVDLEFALSAGTSIFAGAGAEFALGRTEIYTQNRLVAVVPVARAVGFLGIRTLF